MLVNEKKKKLLLLLSILLFNFNYIVEFFFFFSLHMILVKAMHHMGVILDNKIYDGCAKFLNASVAHGTTC